MEKQLVIFELGSEYFGIDIASVEGINKMLDITKIPQSPNYMLGITNLRGSVLPVICLQTRFGLETEEHTNETRIVVASLEGVKVGMVVSAVSEVLTIDDAVIEPPPPMVSNINSEFIVGVAKIDKRLVILLDLSKILTIDEKIQIAKTASV
ncbi:MAG: chemotaxis protein CheW [Chloroflexi bacterium HGW-Chloroflexi-4]|jgi:purine-binding chemotaxis protein CheW|nr:MAG: chemotaxis protein CheW [Chloroflexi bacterium HGW-Chloroflexi-4]